MHKRRYSLLFGITIVFILTLAAACGGDDDGTDATPGPDETGTAVAGRTGEPAATQSPDGGGEPAGNGTPSSGASPSSDGGDDDDEASGEAERAIQRIGGAVAELESLVEAVGRRVPESPGAPGDDEDVDHWFEVCCDSEAEDIEEELRDIGRAVSTLLDVYAESGDGERLQAAERLANHVANIEAWLSVLSTQPTSEGAAAIVGDMSLEASALADTLAAIR